jgi:hypothetical protein
MKLNFTNEDFERFIKQQADQLRMRPSDKVWNNISGELHTKRRWVGLGILFFVISITSASTYLILTNGAHQRHQTALVQQPDHSPTNEVLSNGSAINLRDKSYAVSSDAKQVKTTVAGKRSHKEKEFSLRIGIESASEPSGNTTENSTNNSFIGTFGDSYVSSEEKLNRSNSTIKAEDREPNSIESVINQYRSKKQRLSWQFYFTPTVSYRKLSENKSYLRKIQQVPNSSLSYAELYNINDVVTHKPDLGLELGAAAKYALGKKVSIRTGLQFNMAHYDIKAFDTYSPQMATIALNTGTGIDSVNTMTKYKNLAGPATSWLQNFYFELSAPIGMDVVLASNKNVKFGISTTIQPTYVLGERAYLISSDYQNYTRVPWLMRKWNVNTSLETFISYSTGQLKWQIGPQVRYQLLSSFINEYPVKENLFDFGLKVGVGLNK